jgi:uracil-DNA glycosylase
VTSEILSELGFLARQLRFQGELDQFLGLQSSPNPLLEAFQAITLPSSDNSSHHEGSKTATGASPSRESARRKLRPQNKERLARREPEGVRVDPAGNAGKGAIVTPTEETDESLTDRRRVGEAALAALFNKMDGCTKCRLHEGRTRLVFGQGDAAAEIAFVGEGPGYQEDKQGYAFCGPSGDLLTKMIGAMGLERSDAFIANIVKCRPPGNRNPQADEMATCIPFLEEQLEIVRPTCIVALGKTAGVGLGLLRPDESLGRNRGFQHRWRGIRVMLTYHPAYLLRNPSAKRMAWHDLKQVMPYLRRRRGGSA